jgi:putative nucleotidyltransferase with HDIG domain
MKKILFVDDEVSILDGLKRMLRPMRTEWEMSFAPGGEPALALMDSTPFDVIVTDMRMPGMDGATLLEIVREKHPNVLRIILSGYTELQASIRAVPVAHQFLLKPCDPEMLRAGISRATSLGEVLDSRMLTSLVGALRDLPSLPRVFTELRTALLNPKVSIEQIARIVEKDVAVCAKLLQLVNSAFFGLARDVTDVKTAVSCLGLTVLYDLVITVEVFRSFKANEFISDKFIDDFHAHSQLSARIAAGISNTTKVNSAVVLAALLHDIGKLVIAERTPAHFARVLAQSENEGRPFHEVEEQLTHISHAEVGAYLLSLWGLPYSVVEAVAHHHHPRRVPQVGIDMILVVYVSNILAQERAALAGGPPPLPLDMALLEENHAASFLPEWRKIAEAADTADTAHSAQPLTVST